MISTPTTFVIGAGAGVPYGYPTGAELSRIIMGDANAFPLHGGEESERKHEVAQNIRSFVERAGVHETEFSGLEAALRYSPFSIDALLQRRDEFLEVGKLAIAAALLPFELNLNSALFPYKGDWLHHLIGAMYSDDGSPEHTVRFVTFNYDRLLEHRLTLALSVLRGVSLMEAWEEVKRIQIVHVYGQLGEYSPEPVAGTVCWDGSFLSAVTAQRIIDAAKSIRLIYERGDEDEPTPQVEAARRFISESRRVWFLGFGFDATNVGRLASSLAIGTMGYGIAVAGSSLGMTESERLLAKLAVSKALQGPTGTSNRDVPEIKPLGLDRIALADADCLMTLRTHAELLS